MATFKKKKKKLSSKFVISFQAQAQDKKNTLKSIAEGFNRVKEGMIEDRDKQGFWN